MTDYSLWEVILNGDSPVSTRIVEGISHPVAPTTVEQKLSRKNELKARGTLLMPLPDKHQLKFNSHKDAKTLMEAIEKRFGRNTETKKVQKTLLKQQFENFIGSSSKGLDQIHDRFQKLVSQLEIHERNKADLEDKSLDDLFNSLKICETEVKYSSSTSTESHNLAFVSSSQTNSTTDSVSVDVTVSAVGSNLPASPLPNIDVNDLKEMDLRWQMAILTMRARRFLQKTGQNLGANGTASIGFDMTKVECYNCHWKGHFARECRSPKDQRRPEEEPANFALIAFSSNSSSSSFDNEFDVISYQTGLESVEGRLLVYKQNESVFEENIKMLNIEVQLRDTALVTLRQKLEASEKERNDLKLKLEKFIPCGGYHAVPPPYTETFMPPKPDLVFHTAPFDETEHLAFNVQVSPTKTEQALSSLLNPSAPIIEDWVFNFEEDSKPNDPQQSIPSFAQSSEHVKPPSHFVQPIETTFQAAPSVPTSPKYNSSGKRRNRKTCFVCKIVDHLIKDCDFHATKIPVSTALPNLLMTRPRHAYRVVTKSKSPIRRHLPPSPSSKHRNSPPRVTTAKTLVQEASPAIVEPLRIEIPFLEDQFQEDLPKDPPEVPMADDQTMAELLRAPTEGYEDAIVIPEIAANNFELKHGLINLVQNKQFFGHDKEDPHAHIRYFNKITSTMMVPNVPSSSIKLMLFPFSLEGAAWIWLEKEAPRSILTWEDLVSKFINQFFPPSKTTNLRSGTLPSNTITNPKEDLKGITTRSGVAYQGPIVPTPSKVVKQGTEVTKDQVQTPRMDECLALADLGARINLMPLSMWEGLLLPKRTPTYMTLELTDRSVSKPIGIAKDVSVKVVVFHFPADFMVVDFEPDPRAPLILGRCFLKTGRALIDVHKAELTLHIGNEAITYNLDQTLRYSANYNQMTLNKIDVICEEYSQEVL
nr:ribonuclease H-like domain-containing protein [Tanacetum cinerariifolium]